MRYLPSALERAMEQFEKLPGIGPKTAERFVLYLMKRSKEEIIAFTKALIDLKNEIHLCPQCFNFADNENELCGICSDPKRDRAMICVVAESSDVVALEHTSEYKGVYHVLGGILSPIHGITPDRIRIQQLLHRVELSPPHEIILALNPDIDGETTSLYLTRLLKGKPFRLTHLARGLPMGSDLDYADEITLTNALTNRRDIA
ncbi:MAG TPA: recombination mediator RecR [Patescibacteria group bacterium]|nr:recombination mediator RecR [Patescibacteria group bacterium]